MKNLNICIDIDGTITDPYYWLPYANKYFGTDINEVGVIYYDIPKILNITEPEYLKFYDKFKTKIHSEQKLRSEVKETLDKLNKFSHIYFVTAREKSLELLTLLYLKSHQLPFKEVYVLGTHDKVPTAKQLKSDIFIEDNYDNAIQLSNSGFKVILIDTNYNRHPLNDNITRVSNWYEILEIIENTVGKEEAI